MEFIPSNRGNSIVIFEGHSYFFFRQLRRCAKTVWRCSKYYDGCRGILSNQNSVAVVEHEHNHPPDENRIKKLKERQETSKETVSKPTETPTLLVLKEMPNSSIKIVKTFPKTLLRDVVLQRQKAKESSTDKEVKHQYDPYLIDIADLISPGIKEAIATAPSEQKVIFSHPDMQNSQEKTENQKKIEIVTDFQGHPLLLFEGSSFMVNYKSQNKQKIVWRCCNHTSGCQSILRTQSSMIAAGPEHNHPSDFDHITQLKKTLGIDEENIGYAVGPTSFVYFELENYPQEAILCLPKIKDSFPTIQTKRLNKLSEKKSEISKKKTPEKKIDADKEDTLSAHSSDEASSSAVDPNAISTKEFDNYLRGFQFKTPKQLEYIVSCRGSPLLVLDGYTYNLFRSRFHGKRYVWRCYMNKKSCPSKVTTEDSEVIKQIAHNHPPDPDRIKRLKALIELRKAALNSDEGPTAIVKRELGKYPKEMEAVLPKTKSMLKSVRLQRRRVLMAQHAEDPQDGEAQYQYDEDMLDIADLISPGMKEAIGASSTEGSAIIIHSDLHDCPEKLEIMKRIEIITSIQGYPLLLLEGFSFNVHYKCTRLTRIVWRCCTYKKGCRVSITTQKSMVIMNHEHTHPPDHERNAKLKAEMGIRDDTGSAMGPTLFALKNSKDVPDEAILCMPKMKSLSWYVQSKRKKLLQTPEKQPVVANADTPIAGPSNAVSSPPKKPCRILHKDFKDYLQDLQAEVIISLEGTPLLLLEGYSYNILYNFKNILDWVVWKCYKGGCLGQITTKDSKVIKRLDHFHEPSVQETENLKAMIEKKLVEKATLKLNKKLQDNREKSFQTVSSYKPAKKFSQEYKVVNNKGGNRTETVYLSGRTLGNNVDSKANVLNQILSHSLAKLPTSENTVASKPKDDDIDIAGVIDEADVVDADVIEVDVDEGNNNNNNSSKNDKNHQDLTAIPQLASIYEQNEQLRKQNEELRKQNQLLLKQNLKLGINGSKRVRKSQEQPEIKLPFDKIIEENISRQSPFVLFENSESNNQKSDKNQQAKNKRPSKLVRTVQQYEQTPKTSQRSFSSSQQNTPASQQNLPVSQQNTPVSQQNLLTSQQILPVSQQNLPIISQQTLQAMQQFLQALQSIQNAKITIVNNESITVQQGETSNSEKVQLNVQNQPQPTNAVSNGCSNIVLNPSNNQSQMVPASSNLPINSTSCTTIPSSPMNGVKDVVTESNETPTTSSASKELQAPRQQTPLQQNTKTPSTGKANPMLLLHGFSYKLHEKFVDSTKISWKCYESSKGCLGSITTKDSVVIERQEHNHPPDMNTMEKLKTKIGEKKAAGGPEEEGGERPAKQIKLMADAPQNQADEGGEKPAKQTKVMPEAPQNQDKEKEPCPVIDLCE